MKQARIWSVLLFTCAALLFAACSASRTGTRQVNSPTSSSPASAYQSPSKQTSPLATFNGRVVSVEDGDTIMVLDDADRTYKIRLQGIDAPEGGQAFGNRSRQNLSKEVFDKQVVIEWSKREQYGRIVGKCCPYASDPVRLTLHKNPRKISSSGPRTSPVSTLSISPPPTPKVTTVRPGHPLLCGKGDAGEYLYLLRRSHANLNNGRGGRERQSVRINKSHYLGRCS